MTANAPDPKPDWEAIVAEFNAFWGPVIDALKPRSLVTDPSPDFDDLIAHLFACRREEEALRQTETSASTWTYE